MKTIKISNPLTQQMNIHQYQTSVVENSKSFLRTVAPVAAAVITSAVAYGNAENKLNDLLESKGINYCQVSDDSICIMSGYNGGFYKIPITTNENLHRDKSFALQELLRQPEAFRSFINYHEMVDDIKRQDIIKKGLRIHTYTINNNVSKDRAKNIASLLSKISKERVPAGKLIFIDNDAIYYNKLERTAFCINSEQLTEAQARATFRKCEFETNKKDHAIGYTATEWDYYHNKFVERKYREKQESTVDVPPVISMDSDNKDFAQAYRYGNTKSCNITDENKEKIFDNLAKKMNITNAKESDLQYIKIKDKTGKRFYRVGYYDSSIGSSFIYNEEGKFLYQMDYNRDADGDIVSCAGF